MNKIIKFIFCLLIVKPLVYILLGINLVGRNNLPLNGPAVVVANHNSHLDTIVLLALFPLIKVHKVRPVAAADYFLKNKFLAWLAFTCIGIIPLDRQNKSDKSKLFSECHKALDQGDILIVFPEGSRGEPERVSEIKKGVYHLIKDRDDTVLTPVVMSGLGKALPKGEALFAPFNCDVVIGEPLGKSVDANAFVENLKSSFNHLFEFCITKSKNG